MEYYGPLEGQAIVKHCSGKSNGYVYRHQGGCGWSVLQLCHSPKLLLLATINPGRLGSCSAERSQRYHDMKDLGESGGLLASLFIYAGQAMLQEMLEVRDVYIICWLNHTVVATGQCVGLPCL
jgi:hypothetical protein